MLSASSVSAESVVYSSDSMRDPFKPLSTGEKREINGLDGVESVNDIEINGIVYDPSQGSIAVVNGVMMQAGQKISEVKVVKIEKDYIEFEINGISQTKQFQQDEQI